MATLLQTAQGNGGGYVNSYTKAFGSNVTVGSFLILVMAYGDANTVTITDSTSNTWVVGPSALQTGQRQNSVFYVKSAVGGATTITVTFGSGQYADSAIIAYEWSGMNTSSPLDQSATNTTTTATDAVGPTATTTQASEIAFFGIASATNTPGFTGDATYSTINTQAGFDLYTSLGLQYKTLSSTGAQSASATTSASQSSVMVLSTFKTAAGIVNQGIPPGFF
jgi:hypothetical protein